MIKYRYIGRRGKLCYFNFDSLFLLSDSVAHVVETRSSLAKHELIHSIFWLVTVQSILAIIMIESEISEQRAMEDVLHGGF